MRLVSPDLVSLINPSEALAGFHLARLPRLRPIHLILIFGNLTSDNCLLKVHSIRTQIKGHGGEYVVREYESNVDSVYLKSAKKSTVLKILHFSGGFVLYLILSLMTVK